MSASGNGQRPAEDGGQVLILGMGTGRCGTHALAELLNRQPDAHFTHEQRPLLPWRRIPGRAGIRERLARLRRTRPRRFFGDVALFYLPYIDEAIDFEPRLRVICLERPKEEVVASFCKWGDTVHPLPTDHWAAQPPHGWYHDPLWTRIFPQYTELEGRENHIRRYWDEYHDRSLELARRFPENVRIFAIDALNTAAGVRTILTFTGIPEGLQVADPAPRSAAVEQTRMHPRRVALQGAGADDPKRCVVLVPYASHIAPACEAGLHVLERRGYAVWRLGGCASIELGRSQMATDALIQGFEETMWIDPDIKFDPGAVDRLRAHRVPIVAGVYVRPQPQQQAGRPGLSCMALPGATALMPGAGGGLVEVQYAGGGFLLVRHRVYMEVARRLEMPLCNEHLGRPLIPFFRTMDRPLDDGTWHLPADFSFCEAARQCGHRVLADTTVRLWHIASYEYGWDVAAAPAVPRAAPLPHSDR